MRGIGGPLLCIGDLLSDLGDSDGAAPSRHPQTPLSSSPSSASSPNDTPQSQALALTKLFQEEYNHLNEALSGTDHSWTSLTLKLCSALETANKLVQATNSNVSLLSEKVGELEKIVKRGDSAIASAKAIHVSLNQKQGSFTGSQNIR
ncbi:hypothetical protein I3843_05G202400 [Carya illinoinensis]|uniref:Uncharacterized protein n=1 Tax=Carya illinoinensis TaxID=32201 RepID=A0A8T1QM49_CARIL|nr:uncharacterized protein LOC122311978 isoform X2 [Carya illinoinensis]KAG2709061.1 hypothetical protein I3760_05G221900 [Carya illinoinensis]KAG6655547.1 hypothetical protein CIPAW_05G224500 [Carya illinoinensis]KAG6714774.1 hypothetical protein I3842_05G218800 [Carya illinoinensis]KAG7980805.1 hypothetical protein I3843_05G202400 [Carya illinoinensis]